MLFWKDFLCKKKSLLLQEWYDLLLLLEWGLFAPVVVNCACGHTLLKFNHQLSGTKHPMHHGERGKMRFSLCRWFDGAGNLNGHLSLSLLTTCPFASKENKMKFLSNSLLMLGQLRVCSTSSLASGASWLIYLQTELFKWELGSQERKEILQLNHTRAALFGSQQFQFLLRSPRSFLKPSSTNEIWRFY